MKLQFPRPRTATSAKWWLLTLAVMAFGLFMSQRPSRKHPSPADPGMWLVKEDVKPRENKDPKPSRPEDGPVVDHPTEPIDDPNAGEGPDVDDGDVPANDVPVDDERDDDPDLDDHGTIGDGDDDDAIQPVISGWRLLKVGNGSDFGNGNDWVLVLNGFGFMDGEVPPVVHIGEGVVLTDVFVNQRGRVLNAVVPARLQYMLDTMAMQEIAVQNPGGLNRDPSRWIRIDMDHDKFVEALKAAKPTRFKRGPFFLEMEK
jgi:hypothetical protein